MNINFKRIFSRPVFNTVMVFINIVFISGCALVYKQDIQQGNVVTDEMLNKLEQGMTKTEVQYYIGTPLIEDPFHENRWDYFYAYRIGGDKLREQRIITLRFDQLDQLADISGSAQTTTTQAQDVSLPEDGDLNTVISDTQEKEESFWQGMKRKILRQ